MIHIGGLIALIGKLLRFGCAFIALFVVIQSDPSFWPGIGLFIAVTAVAGVIGFILQAVGIAIIAANDD